MVSYKCIFNNWIYFGFILTYYRISFILWMKCKVSFGYLAWNWNITPLRNYIYLLIIFDIQNFLSTFIIIPTIKYAYLSNNKKKLVLKRVCMNFTNECNYLLQNACGFKTIVSWSWRSKDIWFFSQVTSHDI